MRNEGDQFEPSLLSPEMRTALSKCFPPRSAQSRSAETISRAEEAVGYLTPALRAVAERYAVATRRRLLFFTDIESAIEDVSLRVLITDSRPYSLAQLERIALRDAPLGLVPVGDAERPIEAARTVWAYERAAGSRPGRRVSHLPLEPPGWNRRKNRIGAGAVGASASRWLWTLPAAIKLVQTHSDGIDAYAADDLASCGRGSWKHSDGARAPACVARNHCHRLGRSFDDPLSSLSLFDPAEMVAGVLVWDVCFAVPAVESWNDSASSLLHRLWSAAAIGAVITNFEIALTSRGHLEDLGDRLVGADTIGDGLIETRKLPEFARKGRRWILFGDPAISIHAPIAGEKWKRPVANLPVDGNASVLATCLRLDGLAELAAALERRDSGSSDEAFSWLLSRGKMHDLWLAADDVSYLASRPCDGCGGEARGFKSSDSAQYFPRCLWICKRCGVVADVDHGNQCALVYRAGSLALLRPPPSGSIRKAAIQFKTDEALHTQEWPCFQAELAKELALPPEWRGLSGRASLLLLGNAEIVILSAMIPPRSSE
jgi:hypothetical protein